MRTEGNSIREDGLSLMLGYVLGLKEKEDEESVKSNSESPDKLIKDFLISENLLLTPDEEDKTDDDNSEFHFILTIDDPFRSSLSKAGTTNVVCPIGILKSRQSDIKKDEHNMKCSVIGYLYLTIDKINEVNLSKELPFPAKDIPKKSILKTVSLNMPDSYFGALEEEKLVRSLSYILLTFQNEITKEINKLSKYPCYCTFRSDILETKGFNRLNNLIINLLTEKIYGLPTI